MMFVADFGKACD